MALLGLQSKVVEGYLQTAPLAPSLPWREASYAVFGVETTGPDPHRDEIVRVACVPVEGGRAIIGKASEAAVGPGQTHEALAEPICEALTGRVLVAHTPSLHASFLSAAVEAAGIELKGPLLDTAILAAWLPTLVRRERDRSLPPVEISPGLSRAAPEMGLPVHRPQEASGVALTTSVVHGAGEQARPRTPAIGRLARPAQFQQRGLQPGGLSVRLAAEEEHHRSRR